MTQPNLTGLRERLIEVAKLCYIRTPSAVVLYGGGAQLYALREMEKVAHELHSLAKKPGEYAIETLQPISECLVNVEQILGEYGTSSEASEAREVIKEIDARIVAMGSDKDEE